MAAPCLRKLDVSSAHAPGVHRFKTCVVLGDQNKESVVTARAIGVLSGTSSSISCVWWPELVVCTHLAMGAAPSNYIMGPVAEIFIVMRARENKRLETTIGSLAAA